MSVSKDTKRGTWKAYVRYKDWMGNNQVKTKRGFATKKEGLAWEREFLAMQTMDINMSFASFVEVYIRDIGPRLKENTLQTKMHIIEKKILPYFGNRTLASIKATDVLQWQNALMTMTDKNGEGYSQTYLRTIQNQLSAILNHARNFYGLTANASTQAGKMGKSDADEMKWWTQEQYLTFVEGLKDKPVSYYAFELLWATGIREGELLALTTDDFDFENRTLRINKSYQRIKGRDLITSPKTEQSNRTIYLQDYICREMQDYVASLYGHATDERIFQVTKSYLHHEMDRACKKTGVERIRIHDLRHSAVAEMIHIGIPPIEIAKRVGHKSVSITYMYAHLYPGTGLELADKLDESRKLAMQMMSDTHGEEDEDVHS